MRNLTITEINVVAGGFAPLSDGSESFLNTQSPNSNEGGDSGVTNAVVNACNNPAGGLPLPDSATVKVTVAQTGKLEIAGNGTSATNTVEITANCGDARKVAATNP